MSATLSMAEAERVLEVAYPRQGVTIQRSGPNGAFKIHAANGELLGAAFDLRVACRQAVQPVLKAEAARRIEDNEARTQELMHFMQFLREKHKGEFDEWLNAREAKAELEAGDQPGPQPDSQRLVLEP